uniref:RING-type domain-containing protein n=1 Tax=Ditylenchus dipsaci TaxID=166011 RepID=A0A915D8B0_9BILA
MEPQHLNDEHVDRVDGLPASPIFPLFQSMFEAFEAEDIMGRFNHSDGDLDDFGDFAFGERNFNDIMERLMAQADQGQTATISAEDILRLPVTQVNEKQLRNGVQCVTCMEPFVLDERVVALDCKHIFHRQCLEPWLRLHNTCPICRSVVDPKKWPADSTFNVRELD